MQALTISLKIFQRQLLQERLLDEIANHIRQSLSLNDILSTAVSEVRQFLEVDRVLIYRFKPDWNGVVTIEARQTDIKPVLYTSFEEPCFRKGYVERYQAGRVRAVADIYNEHPMEDCYRELLERYQVRANLVVPILQGENVLWGLLIAHHCRGPRHWNALEIKLLKQLTTQLGIAIRQSELYETVQQLAITDELTQLANRRHFDKYLQEAWNEQQRKRAPVALILGDVDFFKGYNDLYGHLAGDDCLKAVGQALSKLAKRSRDLVARYGGEEFAIILPGTDVAGALTLASQMKHEIKELNLQHQGSPFGYVTLSFGVASLAATSDSDPARLILAADQALYRAKASGRDCAHSASG